jgi:hypothetical protein
VTVFLVPDFQRRSITGPVILFTLKKKRERFARAVLIF